MPLGEIAGELLGGVVRWLIVDLMLEIAIKVPGYLICRFIKKDIHSESGWVVLAGVGFWILLGLAAYLGYQFVSEQLAIDRCLDEGGRFDYRVKACINS